MRIPRKAVLLGTTAVTLALIPASSAMAYSPAEQAAEKRQNDRLKKLSRDLSAAKTKLNTNDLTDAAQTSTLTSLNGRLSAIEGGVPTIINGLTALRDGLTTAGNGLKSLQTLATSTEYGVGQVLIGGVPAGGSFLVTPDIPDAVQQAQVSQTFNSGAQSGVITVRVGIRSAETDGTGASNPAGHCRVTVVDSVTRITTSSPNGTLGGAPFHPIPEKSVQTSTVVANAGFPFGLKTSGDDADKTVDLTDTVNNALAPGGAASAGAGTNYTVTLACVDTTASASDPAA